MTRVAAGAHIPYEVQAALVDASGKLFWYWDPYLHLLRKAGVHPAVVARHATRENGKYKAMRGVLEELDRAGAPGARVQRQLVEAMANLPLSAGDDIDMAVAVAAQQRLRQVADQYDLLPETRAVRERSVERALSEQRREQAAAKSRAREARLQSRQSLLREFTELLAKDSGRQGRGYRLEEMIGEAARLDGVAWEPPYRKGTATQTDGLLKYEGFRYQIEARWRMDPPDVAAISSLERKVARALDATRGLFISVIGFRDEVVAEVQQGDKSVLLMSGQEFSLILEGRLTFGRAMELKVDEASKRGHVFYDLARVPGI